MTMNHSQNPVSEEEEAAGRESIVMTHHVAEWSTVAAWKPQARYAPIGSVCKNQANNMLEAVEILVRKL